MAYMRHQFHMIELLGLTRCFRYIPGGFKRGGPSDLVIYQESYEQK